MAKIKDVLDIESQRASMEQCRMIYLFQEGTFYRAYEWSAWLCVRYIQQFKTTKRLLKNEDTSIVFVGFPVTSLPKYTLEGADVSFGDDKSVCMALPVTVFKDTTDTQQLVNEFENWKQSVPFTDNSKKEIELDKNGGVASHPVRLTDVLHKIMAYPIERKSPLESMSFWAEIKQDISELL